MAKLKVYRTPAGFHDAYVAAPSQKAALAAWGSTANLFARGIAALVTDPQLTREPLAHPGAVIRVARTAPDEPDPPPRKKPAAPKTKKVAAPKPEPEPKPTRAPLDKADAALEAAEARHADQRRALKSAEEALAARRRALDKAHAQERTLLERAQINARDAYAAALETWRKD